MPKIKAFTLLEVMVVVLLIGIILSFATLSIGDAGLGRRQTQEAQRLLALLRLAQEEALLRQVQIGVAIGRHSYRFVRGYRDGWLEFDDEVFRPRALPAGLAFDLRVEGLPMTLEETTGKPQIILYSSGEIVPFECTLYSPQQAGLQRISGNFNGALALESLADGIME